MVAFQKLGFWVAFHLFRIFRTS